MLEITYQAEKETKQYFVFKEKGADQKASGISIKKSALPGFQGVGREIVIKVEVK